MGTYAVLAQITGVIGWLLLVYSYYKDDIDKLLFIQIISSIFYCLNYYFLGAYSGLIVCFFELLKGIGYYKTDKDDLIFILSLPVYILMGIFSYAGLVSLLPIIGSVIDGFTLTKNKTVATIGSIISNVLWVIYDIIILAYSCAITDGILVVSNIFILLFGYSLILKTNKLRIVQGRNISKNIYDAIYGLDKKNYGEEYTWSYEYEKNVRNKIKDNDSLLMIKYHNEIVGYLSYIVLNENEYLKIINSSEVIKEYDLNNIVDYQKRKKNYLIIDSINVKSKFQNHVSIDLIVKRLKKIIVKKYNEGYKIDSIISIAVNTFEKEVLEKANFCEYKKYSDNEVLYMIDKKTLDEVYIKPTIKKSNYYKFKTYVGDQITEDMIYEIRGLDEKFFKDDYLWDFDHQLSLFNKNKESMIIVKYENKVIGYLNYLVVTKDKYEQILNSNITIDDFKLEEVLKFYKNKNNYLVLNSIVIDKKFHDGYAVVALSKKFKKVLKKMNNDNYRITEINATAVSDDGSRFLVRLGFVNYKTLDDGNHLYVLERENLKNYLR